MARINCLELGARDGFVCKDSSPAMFGKKHRGEKVSIYILAPKDNLYNNIKLISKKVGKMPIFSILPSNFNKTEIKILRFFLTGSHEFMINQQQW